MPQDVASRVRDICNSKAMWCWVGGPSTLSSKSLVVEEVRSLFEGALDVKWIKRSGGMSYAGLTKRVAGWHIMHCTLRELETSPVAPAPVSPSLR